MIRNFYVRSRADGRRTVTGCGPSGRLGGMETKIFQRDRGGILHIYTITQVANDDGTLTTELVDMRTGEVLSSLKTFH